MSLAAAEAYRAALEAAGGRVAEADATVGAAGELELQARWFAGEFGRDWTTEDGEAVRIEDFGRWNHEAGPDFVDTRVMIGGEARRGAIELDLDVRDWERHGHATNPAFREAVVHVFRDRGSRRFFTRSCDHREIPQVRLAPADPAPRRVSSPPDPITRDAARAGAILESAARHRLSSKAAALARHAAVHGEDEAWFAALATAFGYKRNQIPFSLLAQRVTLAAAASARGEALLFGVAGFLEAPEPPAAPPDVRAYLRSLWEDWWEMRARCERWILPAPAWQYGGLRPGNHPHRRVAALAGVAADWAEFRAALGRPPGGDLAAAFGKLDHSFWSDRFNLSAARMGRSRSLVGAERVRDIQLNIHFPLAVARDDSAWPIFLNEPGPPPAAIMREAAARFFGGLPAPFLRRAVVQQGLLQIERDHRSAPDSPAFLKALRHLSPG